jgi:hypothetical protein
MVAGRGAARIGRIGSANGSCASASDENASAAASAVAAVRMADEGFIVESFVVEDLDIMSPAGANALFPGYPKVALMQIG